MKNPTGKKGTMAVDHPDKNLHMKDRVEILKSWKEPLSIGRNRFGTRRKLRVKSLENPGIESDVDFIDVFVRE